MKLLKTLAKIIFGLFVAFIAFGLYLDSKDTSNNDTAGTQEAPVEKVAEKTEPQPEKKELVATPEGIAKGLALIDDDFEVWLEGGDALLGRSLGTLVTTGSKIAAEYEKNEARATKKYKGNYVVIKGRVVKIETGLFDEAYVVIASNKNYGFNNPQLRFSREDKDYPISLDKGDIKTFICIGGSEVIGSAMLEDCYSSGKFLEKLKADAKEEAEYYIKRQDKIIKALESTLGKKGYSSIVKQFGVFVAGIGLGIDLKKEVEKIKTNN